MSLNLKNHMCALIVSVGFCWYSGELVTTAEAAATVEAKRNAVKIFAEPTNKSAVKAELKKGEKVSSLERKGMYWEVKLRDGTSGFVSVLHVTRKAGGEGTLSNAIQNLVKEGRSTPSETSEARSRSTVMGVRGLAASDSSATVGSARPNLRAVYALEDIVVSEAQIQRLGRVITSEIGHRQKQKR